MFHHNYNFRFTSYGRPSSNLCNIHLPALISSILNIVDIVTLWMLVISNLCVSFYGMYVSVYRLAFRCMYCIGGWFKFSGRFSCVHLRVLTTRDQRVLSRIIYIYKFKIYLLTEWNMIINVKIVCKQYLIPYCTHSLNVPILNFVFSLIMAQ